MKKIVGGILALAGIAAAVTGLILKIKGHMSVSIIGGADGPTSIFLAGKVGGGSAAAGIVTGIVLLGIGVFLIKKK